MHENTRKMRTSFVTDEKEIEQIIAECDICFVGIATENGVPYVIPMNFGYRDKEVILHSAPEGRHLDLLKHNNQISVTFCTDRKLRCQHPDVACSYSMESKSVVCRGEVTFLADDDLAGKEEALNLMMKKYSKQSFKYSTPALRNVKVWRVKLFDITAKSFGQNFKTAD